MTSAENRESPFRASGPTQEHAYRRGPRIVALETVVPHDVMPGLMALRIHTDAGPCDGEAVIGHGKAGGRPEAATARAGIGQMA